MREGVRERSFLFSHQSNTNAEGYFVAAVAAAFMP